MKKYRIGSKIFLGIVILVVVATAVVGLWISGSPSEERARRLDDIRVQNLQSVSSAVDQYYNTNRVLPSDLTSLTKDRQSYWVGSIVDPDTGAPYEYRTRTTASYELCASFQTDTTNLDPRTTEPYPPYGNRFWGHGPERTCFNITATVIPNPK